MNRVSLFLTALFAALSFLLSGCQTTPTQPISYDSAPQTSWKADSATRAAPATPARPATVMTPVTNSDVVLKTRQIEVTKELLASGAVGEEVRYAITVKALEDTGTVRVAEILPAGISFIGARPAAQRTGNELRWSFPSMKKGETQTIEVTVKSQTEGEHDICSTVTVDNQFCLGFFTGQPRLEVVKQGPSTVELGDTATWTVTVTNNGSAAARNVVVSDTLPDAFKPVSRMRQSLGTLEPGGTQTVEFSAKAVAQGEFRNRAIASYDGGDGTEATGGESSIPIRVVQSGIRVRKTGPAEAYVFKPVKFDITIENTGDTDLANVRITDVLPKGASVADNGGGRVSGDAIGWMIPNLPAGGSQRITTEIAASRKGPADNTVRVVTGDGLEASDSLSTNWLAVPGVTISITDSKDPIRVRESATYTIQVRNQGDFEPVSGTVEVRFNKSLKPVSVAGDSQGVISGQTVTFPRATLEPGKDINLSVTAEGAEIGPGRAVLEFTSDFLADPIISEEATNVY